MDDYPIDEEKVMAGKDDRIAPAVTAAVEMGFDAELATQAAKEQILLYPGRGDVTELVVEQLLMGAGGGARAFPAPTRMPEKYVAAAEAAAARGWPRPPPRSPTVQSTSPTTRRRGRNADAAKGTTRRRSSTIITTTTTTTTRIERGHRSSEVGRGSGRGGRGAFAHG